MSSSSSSDGDPTHLIEAHFLILVVGDPGCGKTSFIRAFYDNNSPADAYSFNGTKVYPCKIEFRNELRNVVLLEFLDESQLPLEERNLHFVEADAIVFMYAIDDPSSIQAIVDKWLKEVAESVDRDYLNLVILGNKIDLRTDKQVIERLALNNKSPLSQQNVWDHFKDSSMKEDLTFLECSTKNAQSVLRIIRKILLQIDKTVKKIEDDFENENW